MCLTFDHLGRGRRVGSGEVVRPDPDGAELTVAVPRTLSLLRRLGASGTFYVEGWSALHHPDVIDTLCSAGHQVGLHGWMHEPWRGLDREQRERVLYDGRAALAHAGVHAPGFRAPGGWADEAALLQLARLGFSHDSSLLPTEDSGEPEPASGESPGELTAPGRVRRVAGLAHLPFTWPLVDFWQYRLAREPATPDTIGDRLTAEADRVHAAGGAIVLVVHPFFTAGDERRWTAFTDWLEHYRAAHNVRLISAGDLAASLPQGDPPSDPREVAGWARYARQRGIDIGTDASGELLPGGVSATVVRFERVVLKQPKSRLSVEAEWAADRDRVLAEAEAMYRAASVSPRVIDIDRANLVLAQQTVTGRPWKEQLLAGEVSERTARIIGQELGALHRLDPAGLAGSKRLDQLRLQPYFVAAAARLPDRSAALLEIAERLRDSRITLVHGDFSPKNLLVDTDRVWVLDWETTHQGDPHFDVAFLLCHLAAKAIAAPQRADRLRAAAGAFLEEYRPIEGQVIDERWLARLTGALLFARTDGLSRLEYLDGEARERARAVAGELMDGTARWP